MGFNGNGDYTPEEQRIIDEVLKTEDGFKGRVITDLHRIKSWIQIKEADCNEHKKETASLKTTRNRLYGALAVLTFFFFILTAIYGFLVSKLLEHITVK